MLSELTELSVDVLDDDSLDSVLVLLDDSELKLDAVLVLLLERLESVLVLLLLKDESVDVLLDELLSSSALVSSSIMMLAKALAEADPQVIVVPVSPESRKDVCRPDTWPVV